MGTFEASIVSAISRVEEYSPPGVERLKTISVAPPDSAPATRRLR